LNKAMIGQRDDWTKVQRLTEPRKGKSAHDFRKSRTAKIDSAGAAKSQQVGHNALGGGFLNGCYCVLPKHALPPL
jgi:hypothetical protein